MTQTPDYISVSPGQTVTMTCTASLTSSGNYNNLAWYQQKDQQPPKLFIYDASTQFTHSIKSVSANYRAKICRVYSRTINGATADDEGRYYCQHYWEYPLTQ
uniref:Ig-like domain-containing protein n=1 Tax=Pyxicephalus adspersus TaxID=30357 RepID=A0AAV3APL8_PYXAD|nr:TPA: hypothetical protein GDO54_009659 [Pyxicephalus adspersus]